MSNESHRPTYVIFGAYGGVGSALARRLARGGARLVLSGRDPEALGALRGELGAEARPVDATDLEAVAELLKEVRAESGPLTGVANCVGSLLLKPAHMTRPQE